MIFRHWSPKHRVLVVFFKPAKATERADNPTRGADKPSRARRTPQIR